MFTVMSGTFEELFVREAFCGLEFFVYIIFCIYNMLNHTNALAKISATFQFDFQMKVCLLLTPFPLL